jgi:hypothetical protein
MKIQAKFVSFKEDLVAEFSILVKIGLKIDILCLRR